jgi:hypothetical protein
MAPCRNSFSKPGPFGQKSLLDPDTTQVVTPVTQMNFPQKQAPVPTNAYGTRSFWLVRLIKNPEQN